MTIGRWRHGSVMFEDGRIMVVAGERADLVLVAEAEIYDPVADTWTDAGSLTEARALHSTTLLKDGRVLVVGGVIAGIAAGSGGLEEPVTGNANPGLITF